jgi:two-component system, sensor histidine kinase and response regulator
VIIYTELLHEENNNAIIKFSILDTGIGINAEKSSELFKPFIQGGSSISRRYGGTGLGLSISRHLVNLMGGDISAENRPEKGSNFSFTIYVHTNDNEKRKYILPSKDLKGLNVLVVDNNKTIRNVISGYLDYFSFNSKTIPASLNVLDELRRSEQIKSRAYGLIILDIKRTDTDSINVIIQIKSNNKFKNIPILVMVDSLDYELSLRSIKESDNIDGFIVKPLTASSLFDAIMEVFGYESQNKEYNEVKNKLTSEIDKIRGSNLLLVEDNEINQQLAVELLESEGFWVTVAENGKQAINKIKNNKIEAFDCVLMDIQMPELDGYEATKLIRKEYSLKTFPVVAMTADAVVGVKEKCLAAGMNDYITKPINPDDLFSKLVKWIKPANRKINISQKKDSKNNIPDIMFLNTEKAIQRLKGNSKAYVDIILKFKNNYSNIITTIKNHFDNYELDKLQLIIHSIKGVSGNISAEELYQSCIDFESSLKQKDNRQIKKAIKNFESEMKKVLGSITVFEQRLEKTAQQSNIYEISNKNVEKNLGKTLQSFKSIEKLLSENNMKARELLESITIQLDSKELFLLVQNLLKELDGYNFNTAYQLLHDYLEKQTKLSI